jgi:hypothetical protein
MKKELPTKQEQNVDIKVTEQLLNLPFCKMNCSRIFAATCPWETAVGQVDKVLTISITFSLKSGLPANDATTGMDAQNPSVSLIFGPP